MSTWLSLPAWKLLCQLHEAYTTIIYTTDKVRARAARTLIRHGFAESGHSPEAWEQLELPDQVDIVITDEGDHYVTRRRRNL